MSQNSGHLELEISVQSEQEIGHKQIMFGCSIKLITVFSLA